ncbi:MAG: hypothetical protein AAF203_01235 [Pseudomonadota bacterium]
MTSNLLKAAAILWVIWGLVHAFAGIVTIMAIGDPGAAVAGITDAVDPELLKMDYHPAVGGILGQHGFNLLWFGVVTTIGAFFIWRKSIIAIFVTAMVGGLADTGYFLFLDLGEFVHFVPGTVMTLICASAILLSFYVYYSDLRHSKEV